MRYEYMGLYNDITTDLSDAFAHDLADAVKPLQGVRISESGYDPITGQSHQATLTYQGQGVFTQYSHYLVDGKNILASDTKLVALQTQVTETPQVNDRINQMVVVSVQQDPISATYTVQLRHG